MIFQKGWIGRNDISYASVRSENYSIVIDNNNHFNTILPGIHLQANKQTRKQTTTSTTATAATTTTAMKQTM